jgi:hypothetical protein
MSRAVIKAVVERFDGDTAIIETAGGTEYRLNRAQLPKGCKVGHHLQMEIEEGDVKRIEIDADATSQAQERIDDLMDRLRRGDHLKKDEE